MDPQIIDPRSEFDQVSDIEWALGDLDILNQYAGQIVVVHRRRVWGSGLNHQNALQNARIRPDCPGLSELVFVPIPESPWFDVELFRPSKMNSVSRDS